MSRYREEPEGSRGVFPGDKAMPSKVFSRTGTSQPSHLDLETGALQGASPPGSLECQPSGGPGCWGSARSVSADSPILWRSVSSSPPLSPCEGHEA